ncbi:MULTISPECIES: DUF3304 domain-containing protein [unclassified Janthinobacterium]|uniref:DUF3304 domain-containing protein n=1 Tax=unclassified Janthinobacterium TaxID=2610881 RepID=UPI0027133831|nr:MULTISPECIES: DUF3304 domain-containing protein [unclassified Janthinobacterium]MDO8066462.1 DUF3304 domain-containing protein [Janthinobacterium sp. SUN206]MDO8072685.1 DUF3304 domain-containing protein [Janthinobacterium sp. SUN176]
MIVLFRQRLWRCLLLAACLPGIAMAASIQALNYSSREVDYIAVENPGNTNSGGGGDSIRPYGQGGSICCFSVPEKWHADLKVVVVYQLSPDPTFHRETVSVPPYPDGKAGDIWLIVYEDGSVGAVVSLYGPSRPEWPGKIKGYPVPTKEYRDERRKQKLNREKASLLTLERGLLLRGNSLPDEKVKEIQEIIEFQKKVIQSLEGNP